MMGTVPNLAGPELTEPMHGLGPFEAYIETGVSEGTSLSRAVQNRDIQVFHGIECDRSVMLKIPDRIVVDPRVHLHEGSSLFWLPKVIDPELRTVFWLDAHYDGARSTSFVLDHGQCPLIEELEIILKAPWKSPPVILIDDAFVFCSQSFWEKGAHGSGMDWSQWPSFRDIYDAFGGQESGWNLLVGADGILYCWKGHL